MTQNDMLWRKCREEVAEYSQMWVNRDFSRLGDLLSQDCLYEECYGPVYCGLGQIHQWITDKLREQVVSSWIIHDYIHGLDHNGNPVLTLTWTFAAKEQHSYMFDGSSIVDFRGSGENLRIVRIREFSATHLRTHPYERVQK